MNLTRRSLFASAVALLALPRRVAVERLLGPAELLIHDDGVSDDTGALQAIIDRTKGLHGRFLPQRTFRVSRQLIFQADNTGMTDMCIQWIGSPWPKVSISK